MHKLVRLALDSKQSRRATRDLHELFSNRALESLTIERLRQIELFEMLERRLKIGPAGLDLLMSDSALAAYRRLLEALFEAGEPGGLCTRGDIDSALRSAYEDCWKARQEPENVDELVDLVSAKINAGLKRYTFASALRGVSLDGLREMQLGKLQLVASIRNVIEDARLERDGDLDRQSMKRLTSIPCLVGTRIGTFEAVKRWYREQAYLTAGMLAVEAGASYERAATGFFIEPEFENPSGSAGSVHLFWSEGDRHLGHNISFGRGLDLKITAERAAELLEPGAFDHAFHILQKDGRSNLEEAITKAVYWYGDAHRDPVLVMQFVKYWSCLECLLGGSGEKLTETLAMAVVTVLSFGHYRFFKLEQWEDQVRQVKRLYALRSRAVHHASHTHVSWQDVVLLGNWAAWVIYNAISFSNAGMKDVQTLWSRVREVAGHRAREGD